MNATPGTLTITLASSDAVIPRAPTVSRPLAIDTSTRLFVPSPRWKLAFVTSTRTRTSGGTVLVTDRSKTTLSAIRWMPRISSEPLAISART